MQSRSRPLLAMSLCLAIFLLWTYFSSQYTQQEKRRQLARQAAQEAERKAAQPAVKAPQAAETPAAVAENVDATAPSPSVRPQRPRQVQPLVESDSLELDYTTQGGGITDVRLPKYKAREDPERSLMLLRELDGQLPPLALTVVRIESAGAAGDDRVGELPDLGLEDWELLDTANGQVRFRTEMDETGGTGDGSGVVITKTLKAVPEDSFIELIVTLENKGQIGRSIQYRLLGANGLTSESTRAVGSDLTLVAGQISPNGPPIPNFKSVGQVSDSGWYFSTQPCYASLQNNYFASILAAVDEQGRPSQLETVLAESFPEPNSLRETAIEAIGKDRFEQMLPPEREKALEERKKSEEVREDAYKTARVSIRGEPVELGPGASASQRYIFYLGPRKNDLLARFDHLNLVDTNDYGFTSWLVNLFLSILEGFHTVTHSWGLAILCLTLIVRTCLHPINRRQQIGMTKYQKQLAKIQPQIKEIQKKYEKDRMKVHQEMQKLFKEHNIRHSQMFGGCLMVFLQLPIWIGLIRTLDYSIDLRQAPFLWIVDLSQPDRLFTFSKPFLFITDLNILPLAYVLLMLVQQKLQPKAADPQAQQTQRMMSFMMIAFGFIFYSFPSGLMVYFITSALFGITESRLIKRTIAKEEAAKGVGGPVTGKEAKAPTQTGPLYASSKVGPGRNKKKEKKEKEKQKGPRF